jgi:hypothetical protein
MVVSIGRFAILSSRPTPTALHARSGFNYCARHAGPQEDFENDFILSAAPTTQLRFDAAVTRFREQLPT